MIIGLKNDSSQKYINHNIFIPLMMQMTDKSKIEEKIKDLNAMRATYHRDFETFEKQYKNNEITKEQLEKHKIHYEKKRDKIKNKIQALEQKLEKIRKQS
jgi:septal ring factor EnvC (AmiA/AmiB activator)